MSLHLLRLRVHARADIHDVIVSVIVGPSTVADLQGGPKSKPLPNYKKVVLNRIKACQ